MDQTSQLKTNNMELLVNLSGKYSLNAPNFHLKDCSFGVLLNNNESITSNWQLFAKDEKQIILKSENTLGMFTITFKITKNSDNLDGFAIKYDAKLNKPCRELNFVVLKSQPINLEHLFLHGACMGRAEILKFPLDKAKEAIGSAFAMLSNAKKHLFISTPLQQKIPSNFLCKVQDNELTSCTLTFDTLHLDRLEIESDWVSIYSTNEPFKIINSWTDNNTEVVKTFPKNTEYGWNSWDYYRWTITEDEVLKNAEAIAKDPVLSKYIKKIIVDDGWQYCYGEWKANSLFPNGMEYLAKEIKKMGFKPGLWIAPTIVEPHAIIAQTDASMLGLSEGGQPALCYECMQRHGFVLDPTVPKSQKFLHDLFDHYASIGYEYFKLDFMGQTFKARQFHDRNVSRSEISKMILKPIYEGVKGRAEILGCNYFFNGGNEYVDAVRIGGDIHAKWNSIGQNVISVAGNFYSNKKWFLNDPDFALCRSFDTANDPDMEKIHAAWVCVKPEDEYNSLFDMTLVDIKKEQVEMLLSIVLMAAGAINLSDDMTKLNEKGLDLARRLVSAKITDTGIPLDLFETDKPTTWLQKVDNNYRVLLINWEDDSKFMEFDFAKHNINVSKAFNFWNDEIININDNLINVKLEGRSCLLLETTI